MTTLMVAINKMIEDASKTWNVNVTINQSNRSPEQAQQFHICHMFLYNYFKSKKPAKCDDGQRTISWDCISDPKVKWAVIDNMKSTFLLTATGVPAQLKPGVPTPEWLVAPDKKKSTHAMAAFLKGHHVKSMAAPGIEGCGDPCGCKGHASKHLTGLACDLHGLDELGDAILKGSGDKYKDSEAAIDDYLHGYGLYRPMAHLEGNRKEIWHVESIPQHLSHPKVKHVLHRRKHQHHHPKLHHGC